MLQQLRSFSSTLHCNILEVIIIRYENISPFNYDISALINCYIFDRYISIYLQLGTRKLKTSPYTNKLTLSKFNNVCRKSRDVYFIREKMCTLLKVVRY